MITREIVRAVSARVAKMRSLLNNEARICFELAVFLP